MSCLCVLQFYQLPIAENGLFLNAKEIFEGLKVLVDQSTSSTCPVGVLPSDSRDRWAGLREELIKGDFYIKLLSINYVYIYSVDVCHHCYSSCDFQFKIMKSFKEAVLSNCISFKCSHYLMI